VRQQRLLVKKKAAYPARLAAHKREEARLQKFSLTPAQRSTVDERIRQCRGPDGYLPASGLFGGFQWKMKEYEHLLPLVPFVFEGLIPAPEYKALCSLAHVMSKLSSCNVWDPDELAGFQTTVEETMKVCVEVSVCISLHLVFAYYIFENNCVCVCT